MTLRDEMCDWLSGDLTGLNRYLPEEKIEFLVDRQLALIEGQRCEWTEEKAVFHSQTKTSCGHTLSVWYPQDMAPYCPCCGRKIEVKDGV